MGQAFWQRAALTVSLVLQAGSAFSQDMQLIERGRYLAAIGICESCHTPKDAQGVSLDGRAFAGGHRVGGILGSNITPDRETGIGTWSDQQIIDAIRNGKRPNGETVRPPMGVFFYRSISDDDALALVAYLRTLQPISNEVKRVEGRGPAPVFAPVHDVPAPNRQDRLAYGRYLGETVAHCYQCHTPRKDGMPDLSRAGAGGNTYTARGGGQVTASNITEATLSTWTDDEIKSAITKGLRPDGSTLAAVMDFDLYSQFSPDDLGALVAYMRSVPVTK